MGGEARLQAARPVAIALRDRLVPQGPLPEDRRLAAAVADAVGLIEWLVRANRLGRDDVAAVIRFLTEVGEACGANRQEWVLLCDALGVSSMIHDHEAAQPRGATPSTIPGPFWREGVPLMPDGADIARVADGEPLAVTLRLSGLDGAPVPGARVDVWQANGKGVYENQDPDNQPEGNLRGAFLSGEDGAVRFRTERPAGYALPTDGPVGRLLARLGLPARRPAHIHVRVRAEGHAELVTHVFDGDDPWAGHDALFADRPELMASFAASPDGMGLALDWRLVLAPTTGANSIQPNGGR